MSWDVSIMRFSRPYTSMEEIPDDEKPLDLGPRDGVHRAVREIFPGTDWSDPAWGIFDLEDGSIEFNLGQDDPAKSMMLHIRASNEVIPAIVALCRAQSWSALDCSTGELLEQSEDPTAGLDAWREYRDRVLRGNAES